VPSPRHRFTIALGALLLAAAVVVPASLGVPLYTGGLLQAVAGSALLVGCSALALNGSRPVPVAASRAVPVVLATTAANAVTPAGIGGTLLTLRFHKKSGLTCEQAAAAAGLRTAFGALSAMGFTALVASQMGLPTGGTAGWLVAAGLVAAVVGACSAQRVRVRVMASMRAVGDVLRQPRCLVSLVLGCAGVTVAQLLTLQGAVHAVGGHIPWAELLVALMGSAAARSAVPSPGGVGPIETALVGGLSALGMSLGAATVAVAVYRTAGHWLPVLGGVLSLRELRRRHLV
jgi:uncharacterized membrane protein YbhN (UPF0104 family)